MYKVLGVLIGAIVGGMIALVAAWLLGPVNTSLALFLLGYDEASLFSNQHEEVVGMILVFILGEALLGALIGAIVGFLIRGQRQEIRKI